MFYTEEELQKIGFKKVGYNVKLSTKTSIYRPECMELGNNIRIDDFCVLNGKITLGNNIHVAVYTYLDGGYTGIVMEDFATIAYRGMVFTGTDDYLGFSLTNLTIPLEFKPHMKDFPITIKKHVLIGSGCTIFPGVTIGEGTSIGAMSLVQKDTEEWSIYYGIPAVKRGRRSKKLLELEKQYLESEKNKGASL